ncbi:hypothetical protein BJ170DRAFT_733439 [Xylariales sp. AK1849]|nr:hypothetical protein BJ170DRAFT_733439 [Xylariales sp. AK1849]
MRMSTSGLVSIYPRPASRFGDSSDDNPKVILSEATPSGTHAGTITPLASYTTSSALWQTLQDPEASLPASYTSAPTYGPESIYYATEADWPSAGTSVAHSSPNAFEYFRDPATGSFQRYGAPRDVPNYTYHQARDDFGSAASPPFPIAPHPSSVDVDPSRSDRGQRHHSRTYGNARTKKSKRLSVSPSSSSAMPGPSKLRSASGNSKNTHHNPPSTEEERKSRASHNQTEKQYRRRLNTHFELKRKTNLSVLFRLLEALPESMRGGSGGDDDDEDIEAGGSGGGSEKKISKAEVLEMATRHIKTLGRECAALEDERDELRENIEQLRHVFKRYGDEEGIGGKRSFQRNGGMDL